MKTLINKKYILLWLFIVSIITVHKAEATIRISYENMMIFVPETVSLQLKTMDKSHLETRYYAFLKDLYRETQKHLPKDVKKLIKDKRFVFTMVEGLSPYGAFVPDLTKSWDIENHNLFFNDQDLYNDDYLHILFNPFEKKKERFRILSHEYFHAIHHLLNPAEEDWVKEGLAQLFEWKVTGLPFRPHLEAGLKNLTTPLIAEYDHNKYSSEVYGQHLLYFYYLEKNCGGEKLFWDIARSMYLSPIAKNVLSLDRGQKSTLKRIGIENIDIRLKNNIHTFKEQCRDFDQSALSFQLARILNSDVWDISDEKMYFLYSYHPSPIINIYYAGIAKYMPKYMPFLVTDLSALKNFPLSEQSNFHFYEIYLNFPKGLDKAGNLLDLLEKKTFRKDTLIFMMRHTVNHRDSPPFQY